MRGNLPIVSVLVTRISITAPPRKLRRSLRGVIVLPFEVVLLRLYGQPPPWQRTPILAPFGAETVTRSRWAPFEVGLLITRTSGVRGNCLKGFLATITLTRPTAAAPSRSTTRSATG